MREDATAALVRRLRAAGCVFAEDEAALLTEAAGTPQQLASLAQRRVAGEPLEQVLGWVEFCGLRIGLEAGVFVPRQRSAFLVEQAAQRTPAGAVVVDLCCGSGALGLALARLVGQPRIELHAADLDPAAVLCAQINLRGVGAVYEGDLFAPLPPRLRGQVRTLLANVPYVPTTAIARMPPEARDHEPRLSLDGGADGLDVLRRVARGAADWLAPGGHVLVESGGGQADAAVRAFAAAGLQAHSAVDDDRGATVIVGRSPQRSQREQDQ